MVKIKREHEMIFFTIVIVVSIVFSLYYSGFNGDLPTGMAITPPAGFNDLDNDGVPDVIQTLCAAFAPLPDTDGDLIGDACETANGMTTGSTDSDSDGVSDTTEVVADNGFGLATTVGEGPLVWSSSAAVVEGTNMLGQKTATYSHTFLDVSATETFAASSTGAISAYGGSVTGVAVSAATISYTIVCDDPAYKNVYWEVGIGEGGIVDSSGNLAVMADAVSGWQGSLSGVVDCPQGTTGGSNNCGSSLISPETIRYQSGVPFEVLLEVSHQEVYRNKDNLEDLETTLRIAYPLTEDGVAPVKAVDTEAIGLVEHVDGIADTNLPAVVKVILVSNGYEGNVDLVTGVAGDPTNKCFDRIYIEPTDKLITQLPCPIQNVKENIEIEVSDVAVDNGFFSFHVDAVLDTEKLECAPDMLGEDISVVSVRVLDPDMYLLSVDGKGDSADGDDPHGGFGRGGLGGFGPGGTGPGTGPREIPPGPGRGRKKDVPIIVTIITGGGIIIDVPTTVAIPIPITDIPVPEIDIPDEDILDALDNPFIVDLKDWPPGYSIPPDYTPTTGPDPGVNPNPMPPNPIINRPRVRYKEGIKHYAHAQNVGEVSTDELKNLNNYNLVLTKGVASGMVYAHNRFNAPIQNEVVRVMLVKDGKKVEGIRSAYPVIEGRAYTDIADFTTAAVAGEVRVSEWKSELALKTDAKGNAAYQLDYTNLEDGRYTLAAIDGNDIEVFYLVMQGLDVTLEVPGLKIIKVIMELLERSAVEIGRTTLYLDKSEQTIETRDTTISGAATAMSD